MFKKFNEWLEENIISQTTLNTSMNWMVKKGIIICDSII